MVTGHSAKSRAASVAQDLLDSFVAFVTTAVAREIDEVRGEGVSHRVGILWSALTEAVSVRRRLI